MTIKTREQKLKSEINSYKIEWFLLIFSLAILFIFVAYPQYIEKNYILSSEKNRLFTQAKILNNSLAKDIKAINQALLSIKNDFESREKKEHIQNHLMEFTKVLPSFRTIVILDKNADVVMTNRKELFKYNYKDREYFQEIKNSNDKKKLFITAPYKSVLDVWTINAGVVLEDENKEFAGVVIATFEPTEIKKFLSSISYAKDMRISIIHNNGVLFLTEPKLEGLEGKNINKEGTLFHKYLKSKEKSTVYMDFATNLKYKGIVTFKALEVEDLDINAPLYFAVSREYDKVLRHFYENTKLIFALYIMLIVSSIPGLFFLQRRRYISLKNEIEAEEIIKEKLESLAYIDSLTQIANRRYFEQVIEQEWRYCLRNQKYLSLLFIDIDFFKNYNDTYGHQKGDEVLQLVATEIKNSLKRSHDLVARYGGEEFVVILPNTSKDDAIKIANEMIRRVNNLRIPHKSSGVENIVTISLGLSSLIPSEELSHNDMLKEADDALYKAKNSGKNQVFHF